MKEKGIMENIFNGEDIPKYLMRKSISKLLKQWMEKSPESLFQL